MQKEHKEKDGDLIKSTAIEKLKKTQVNNSPKVSYTIYEK